MGDRPLDRKGRSALRKKGSIQKKVLMALWQELMRPAADNWECSDEKVHALIHLMTGMWFGGG